MEQHDECRIVSSTGMHQLATLNYIPIYSTHHHHPSSGGGGSVASSGNNGLLAGSAASGSLCGSVGGSSASYVYVHQQPQHPHQQQHSAQQQHYVSPQQLTYHLHSATSGGNGYHHHGSHQNIATPTLHKKGSIRSNGDVLKRTRVQNACREDRPIYLSLCVSEPPDGVHKISARRHHHQDRDSLSRVLESRSVGEGAKLLVVASTEAGCRKLL
uniref:Uncharacterized protein n=1 Tax=Anopheles atroparvus TaxID=41427 RepID=A0A182JLY6_ANOAO